MCTALLVAEAVAMAAATVTEMVGAEAAVSGVRREAAARETATREARADARVEVTAKVEVRAVEGALTVAEAAEALRHAIVA